MTSSPNPSIVLDDIAAAAAIGLSSEHRDLVAERAAQVLRPGGAFARLDDVAAWLAGWQHTDKPTVDQPGVIIFGADHGVTRRGVSAYPADVTATMVNAIEAGVATSAALARSTGATLDFVDVGVGRPTADLADRDAMTEERFIEAWAAGAMAVSRRKADVLVLGELGIGNTTAAAAVACGVLGGEPADWVGRGTGVDDAGLERKCEAVTLAVGRLGPNCQPLDVLRRVGGAELVAMAGAAVEARRRRIPIVLDGFIATAALVPLAAQHHGLLDHALAGHCSAEPGHRRLLDAIDKQPLLQLDLRLGEASGALVALPLLRSAVAAVLDVATFAEVGLAGS